MCQLFLSRMSGFGGQTDLKIIKKKNRKNGIKQVKDAQATHLQFHSNVPGTVGVLGGAPSSEDASGVNHLWKGEMWPARVALIRARHVQNTPEKQVQTIEAAVSELP